MDKFGKKRFKLCRINANSAGELSRVSDDASYNHHWMQRILVGHYFIRGYAGMAALFPFRSASGCCLTYMLD